MLTIGIKVRPDNETFYEYNGPVCDDYLEFDSMEDFVNYTCEVFNDSDSPELHEAGKKLKAGDFTTRTLNNGFIEVFVDVKGVTPRETYGNTYTMEG